MLAKAHNKTRWSVLNATIQGIEGAAVSGDSPNAPAISAGQRRTRFTLIVRLNVRDSPRTQTDLQGNFASFVSKRVCLSLMQADLTSVAMALDPLVAIRRD